jgi:hypothetical protein
LTLDPIEGFETSSNGLTDSFALTDPALTIKKLVLKI